MKRRGCVTAVRGGRLPHTTQHSHKHTHVHTHTFTHIAPVHAQAHTRSHTHCPGARTRGSHGGRSGGRRLVWCAGLASVQPAKRPCLAAGRGNDAMAEVLGKTPMAQLCTLNDGQDARAVCPVSALLLLPCACKALKAGLSPQCCSTSHH